MKKEVHEKYIYSWNISEFRQTRNLQETNLQEKIHLVNTVRACKGSQQDETQAMQSRNAVPKKSPTPNKNKEIKAEGVKKIWYIYIIQFQPKIFEFPKLKHRPQEKCH